MTRRFHVAAIVLIAALVIPSSVLATTRNIVALETRALTFNQSVLNQLSGDLFRDPYDEFQSRPYNLPYANIDRDGSLSPWQDQTGDFVQYFNGLIGNNGTADVRNDADSIHGTYIRQPGGSFSWGASVSYVADEISNADTVATSSFTDADSLSGFDVRLGGAFLVGKQISLGAGLTFLDRSDEQLERNFEPGLSGFASERSLAQSRMQVDFGMRHFLNVDSSWDARLAVGMGTTDLNDFSDTLDGTGATTSRFVATLYEVSDTAYDLSGGYNRRKADGSREVEFRGGYSLSQHQLDNSNLSYTEDGGGVTPSLDLLEQNPVTEDSIYGSAGVVFLAGSTQVFSGARLRLTSIDGASRVDSLGTIVDEVVDDSLTGFDLSLGFRQPLTERLRLLASGRADWVDAEQSTTIDGNLSMTHNTQTTTRYSVGLEAMLANMTFDFEWLFGEAITPSPTGARQTIEVDRLVVSALVAW